MALEKFIKNSDPDGYVKFLVGMKPAMAVPHFLIACYMYYIEDDPILSDKTFDDVLVPALKSLPSLVKAHPHGHLITFEHLMAGTGFDLKYPMIVEGASSSFRTLFSEKAA